LKLNLLKTQQTATQERLAVANSVALANKKERITGETRPEWGLAKNAGFIVGRELTKSNNLDGRCFYILIIGKKIKVGKHLKPSCKDLWW
jgi:uncharacterized protein YbcC (UPF0753/DUF2309 family)